MERVKKISLELVLPIGLIVGLFTGFYQLGKLSNQINVNTQNIAEISSSLTNFPTRIEFDLLRDDIKEIKNFIIK